MQVTDMAIEIASKLIGTTSRIKHVVAEYDLSEEDKGAMVYQVEQLIGMCPKCKRWEEKILLIFFSSCAQCRE